MNQRLDEVARRAGEWLRGEGPLHEIVISTRIRLARNIQGFAFLTRADTDTRGEIAETAEGAIRRAAGMADFAHIDVAELDELDRALLVERHLISRQHAESSGARCVAFDLGETAAVMVNEEDHLRIQVMRSGLQLQAAWEQINAIDDALGAHLDYAFHAQYGYLTACPTNVGTGVRVSVMLHLPALRLTNELEKVGQAAKDMKLAIRGLHGEGSAALGDFFQISNQITLGRTEAEIIDDFHSVVIPRIVEYEQAARSAMVKGRPTALDDKVWRAVGMLCNARLISSNEAMQCLSHVRMGLHTGRLTDIDLKTVNDLFLHTQPAHLQKIQGERMNAEQRSVARAELIRHRMSTN